MKKSKAVICFLLASSMMQMSAFADVKVVMNGNKITVTTEGEANEWGSLVVVKSGATLDNENIVTMKQAIADEKGNLVFDFSISDAGEEDVINGKYDLHIKNNSENVKIEEMHYARVSDREGVSNSLKVASTSSELVSVLDNSDNEMILKAMGFDFENYATIKANATALEEFSNIFISSNDGNLTDVKGVSDAVNKAVSAELINISTTVDDSYIADLGFSFEDKEYSDITDVKQKAFIDEYIYANRKYTDINALNSAYEQANILYIINNSRFTDVEGEIKEYADKLGITSNNVYISYLSASNKADVNEDIVESLKAAPATSVQALLAAISTAVSNNTAYIVGNGGGNSGGGSGSGSGNSFGGGSSNTSNNVSLFPAAVSKHTFSDLGSVSWAESAINSLAEKGIVSGDEKGNFNPNNFVKREEFVKMLVAAAGLNDEKANCTFDDVAQNAWYYTYVASAYNNGLVYGISEDEFGVGNNITRQDLAVMCYRAAGKVKEIANVRDSVKFSDADSINDYAKDAVDALYRAGVINGVSADEFAPLSTATRAQAAVMIYNLFVK